MNSRLVTLFLKFSKIIHPSVLSRFGSVRKNLAKASIKTGFKVYMGLMMFTSVAVGVAAFAVSLSLFMSFNLNILHPLVFSILIGVLAGAFSMGICYLYPIVVASSRGSKIDANLPIIANFMSVLASSGMPPEGIFRSLARVGEEFKVGREVRGVIGDIELIGLDLHAALKKASENSPSKRFASMLDGVVTTSHMGGDLARYLREEADKFKKARMVSMNRFLDNLGVIAEAYVTFMVAAPLMLIVMLSVMSFIGGEVTIGSLAPMVLLNLLPAVILPFGIVILILMVDSMSPQR